MSFKKEQYDAMILTLIESEYPNMPGTVKEDLKNMMSGLLFDIMRAEKRETVVSVSKQKDVSPRNMITYELMLEGWVAPNWVLKNMYSKLITVGLN